MVFIQKHMNGQAVVVMEDPLFEQLETWQKENPVRRRVTSADLCKEQGNFVTFCGRYRRKRSARRGPRAEDDDDFQLADDKGVVFVRPTRFITRREMKEVSIHI